jgi:hypothetical protein
MNKGFSYTQHTDRGPHEATRPPGGIIEHDRAKQAGQRCVVAFRRKNEQGFLRQGVRTTAGAFLVEATYVCHLRERNISQDSVLLSSMPHYG